MLIDKYEKWFKNIIFNRLIKYKYIIIFYK